MKGLKKAICYLVAFALVFTSAQFGSGMETQAAEAARAVSEDVEYEIYPTPHAVNYSSGNFVMTTAVNLVFSSKIDQSTKNKAKEILTLKGQTGTESPGVVSGKTNILVGTYGDNGEAQKFIGSDVDTAHFAKIDAYILKVKDGTIAILGRDTDSAFYGLATLKMIVKQLDGLSLRNLTVKDYSDTGMRGFIEGYYGLPWSNQNRMDLMKFGGDIKANTYVFAPKDDAYHNTMWRTLYPADKLNEIKEMAAAGEASKCRFVWSIHPFMNGAITDASYAADIETIKKKFEQLYSVGVRQFGVLADDAGGVSNSLLVRLMNDLTAWGDLKGDVRGMLFCPPDYNLAFAKGSYENLKQLNKMNDKVKMFWTGEGVCGHITKSTVDNFKAGLTSTEKAGRQPLFWLNWPVNDINGSRMLMGRGEVLNTDVTGMEGVITNPMQQSEPSKVAIFAVADYAWNLAGFNMDKSWQDSFKHIEPDASEALHTMAKHLSDPSPNGHGLTLSESEELKPKLEAFITLYQSGGSVKASGQELIAEFQKIVTAVNTFEADTKNAELKKQLSPWTESLREISVAAQKYIETAIALEENNKEKVWSNYSEASAAYSASKKCPVQNRDNIDNVQSGSKRLMPFVKTLSEGLAPKVNSVINPDTEIYTPVKASVIKSTGILGIHAGSETALTDNNEATSVWYKTASETISAGDYIGIDFGREIMVGKIHILQGLASGAGSDDYIQQGALEYSVDGVNYTVINSYKNQKEINEDVSERGIRARYLRMRATTNIKKWLQMREFTASELKSSSYLNAYTNAANLSGREVTVSGDTSSLYTNDRSITLKSGQYLGMMLPKIKSIAALNLEYTNKENLTLESSMNGEEWAALTQEELTKGFSARYIRLINKESSSTSFQLTDFTVKTNEILPMSFLESNISSGNVVTPGNALDRDRTTKANFTVTQVAGQYMIYDMGQTVSVEKLKMVLHDSEVDFIRNGQISVSPDKENWTPVVTIGDITKDPDTVSISEVYPTHEISYYTKEGTLSVPVDARYLKLEITKGYGDRWSRFNEIEINGGQYLPVENNPAFETSHIESDGHTPSKLMDGDVQTTFYTSAEEDKNGELIYHVSDNTSVNKITILQSPGTISGADVSVRYNASQWKSIGKLDKSLNVFDNMGVDHVYEIKIAWTNLVPELHEMYLKKTAAAPATPVNKDALQAKYNEALNYEEKYYTPESYQPLADAILGAKGVLGYLPATAEEVQASLDLLTSAVAGLLDVVPDDSALRAKIEEARALEERVYTKESYDAVIAAISEAEGVLGKPETKQKLLDQKLKMLSDAIDALVVNGTLTKIPSNQLTASAGSEQGSGSDGDASAAVDGNEATYWHSNWSGSADQKPDIPNNIRNEYTIDVGKTALLRKLEYVPRSGGGNGTILKYKLYYSPSASGDDFKEILGAEGTWAADGTKKEVIFRNVSARRLQIRALETKGDSQNNAFISAAEFYVYEIIPNTESYTASFEGGAGAVGNAPALIEAAKGDNVILPANTFTKEGFEFIGWSDGKLTCQPGDEYTMPGQAVVFTAVWKEKGDPGVTKYTASFTGGKDASGIAPDSIEAEEGNSIVLPENTFTKAGFEFIGWNDGNDIYQPQDNYTMPGQSVIFEAQWREAGTEDTYVLSFEGGEGAEGTPPANISGKAGSSITLPQNTFSRAQFVFDGWSDGEKMYQPGSTYIVPQNNVVFTAQWKEGSEPDPAEYTAVFKGGSGASGAAPASVSAKAGEEIQLPGNTFTRLGYQFSGWNDGTSTYSAGSSYRMQSGNVTFTAVWVVKNYTVSFDANGGSVNQKTLAVPEGASIGRLPVPTRSGFDFAGWLTARTGGTKVTDSFKVTTNIMLYAQWTKAVKVPGKVTSLKAVSTGTGSIKLTWKKVSGAKGYMVYRYQSSDKKWVRVRTTKSASYTNKGLKYGTPYNYRVTAYAQSGSVIKEGKISSTLKTGTAPLKPSLKADRKSGGKVRLTWNKTTKSSGTQIYMKTGKSGYKLITTKSNRTSSYTKTKLKKGTSYLFRIKRYLKTDSGKIYSAYSKQVKVNIK